MLDEQVEKRIWLLALTTLVLALATPACSAIALPTPEPTAAAEPPHTPVATKTPKPTNTPKPTDAPLPTKTPEPTNTPGPTNTPRPTATATPRPTGELDTGMGGNLSFQGVVRDSRGAVAPDVYVTIAVYGERGGWGIRWLGGWHIYTDEAGFYSFNNLLRVERGHYEVQLSGDHRYGKVHEQSCYWIGENEISGDVHVLNVVVHPVTGSAFSGVVQYEDTDGSTRGFYSPPFTQPKPDHVIELNRGTPDNLEYPIGVQYCTIDDNTTEWRDLAGGTYHLKTTFMTSDGVVRQCWSPPFEIPPGETKRFEYTIRNCPPLTGWIVEP